MAICFDVICFDLKLSWVSTKGHLAVDLNTKNADSSYSKQSFKKTTFMSELDFIACEKLVYDVNRSITSAILH